MRHSCGLGSRRECASARERRMMWELATEADGVAVGDMAVSGINPGSMTQLLVTAWTSDWAWPGHRGRVTPGETPVAMAGALEVVRGPQTQRVATLSPEDRVRDLVAGPPLVSVLAPGDRGPGDSEECQEGAESPDESQTACAVPRDLPRSDLPAVDLRAVDLPGSEFPVADRPLAGSGGELAHHGAATATVSTATVKRRARRAAEATPVLRERPRCPVHGVPMLVGRTVAWVQYRYCQVPGCGESCTTNRALHPHKRRAPEPAQRPKGRSPAR